MSYLETTIPAENLDMITDEQMMEFATAFNAIEPGGVDTAQNNVMGAEFVQMIDFMDVISIIGILAAVVYLAAPYVRHFVLKASQAHKITLL